MAWFTKNTNPDLYYTDIELTNCGSFALNVVEWYYPGHSKWDYHQILEQYWDGELSIKQVEQELLDWYVKLILEDFKEEIRIIESPESFIKSNEEVVAFRVFVTYDLEINDLDSDFHFRVFRDGRWQEKNGAGEVHDCKLTQLPWCSEELVYKSNIVYFAHQIT